MTSSVACDALYPAHLATLATRASAALAAEGFDALLIHSGFERNAFQDDQAYPYRVNPHFNWWLPLTDAPGSLLYFAPGRRPLLVFYSADDYWHKPPALPDAEWLQHVEVVQVSSAAAARAALPAQLGNTAFIGERYPGVDDLGTAAINPDGLVLRLQDHRVRKTAYEQQCQREANLAGARGHVAAAAAFAGGASEYEIHTAFLAASDQREIELPYQSIVAVNENAATLHYQALLRSAPAAQRSLLIDAGAGFRGYASDITRTYASAPGEFATLIARMDELQQSLAAAVRPGVDWRDLHMTAHQLIAELLREAEIIRIEADEAVHNGLSGIFLPHGLGHLLGLQVHDVAGFRADPTAAPLAAPGGHESLRLTRVLEADFVVTMEPGIYFIDMLLEQALSGRHAESIDWLRVADLRRYGGIRIEDDLVVTSTGHENLTRGAFSRLGA
ncbi:MAG: Xaa-Pro dipeptidase [Pseudomonadota bacterium]